ncbi:TetR/AcrR family transcriptional regulator [Actinoalloteichus hymeniacidonis]|uniref:TetR/AcrR family transcriptional regulator n=1 Tax=Actinoalloteichus hymeniacidonis TaxID=340345 RepID=UPI0015604A12|nr:TetR/AcrR family transcriptional regulator [Actinoalloteichus hymeniacidonis]MBB5907831.1 AcrR family transcriptional regulator [Actinoalloteichus hymeniacidonis]
MPRLQISRDQILDAAAAVITRHGFAKASMADFAAEAGVSKGLLYLRFIDKPALLRALLDREFLSALRIVTAAVEQDERGGLLSRIYLHSIAALNSRPLLLAFYRDDQQRTLARFVREAAPERYTARIEAGRRFIDRLRTEGMVRSDLDGRLADVLSVFAFGLTMTAPYADVESLLGGFAELVAQSIDSDVDDTSAGKRVFAEFTAELAASTEEQTR